MKNAILVMVHLLARLAVLLGTGGTRAVLAENILLKQQLLVLQRSRRRAPNLRTADRWLFGFCAQFVSLRRLIRTASPENRCSVLLFITVIASAFRWSTSTTSIMPRVMPLQLTAATVG